jgi:hypothetical protein
MNSHHNSFLHPSSFHDSKLTKYYCHTCIQSTSEQFVSMVYLLDEIISKEKLLWFVKIRLPYWIER